MKKKLMLASFFVFGSLFMSSCESQKFIYSNLNSPVMIMNTGTFVSKQEFLDLVAGKKITQKLYGLEEYYYLPPDLVKIENGKVEYLKK